MKWQMTTTPKLFIVYCTIAGYISMGNFWTSHSNRSDIWYTIGYILWCNWYFLRFYRLNYFLIRWICSACINWNGCWKYRNKTWNLKLILCIYSIQHISHNLSKVQQHMYNTQVRMMDPILMDGLFLSSWQIYEHEALVHHQNL
jgi:hypothetical protein